MKISYITLAGQRHPLCFSLHATEQISERFGDLNGMVEAVNSADLGEKLRAIDDVLTILLKAGRSYCSVTGEELPPALPCSPSELIDASDPSAVTAIFSTIADHSEREIEAAPPKNADPTQSP